MDPQELARRMLELREQLADMFRGAKIPRDLATCATLIAMAAECLGDPPYDVNQVEWFLGMAASCVSEGPVKTAMIKIRDAKGAEPNGPRKSEN